MTYSIMINSKVNGMNSEQLFNKDIAAALESVDIPSWSDAQLRVFREARFGSGNLVVNAVAGSGKTTTLEGLAFAVPHGKTKRFLAFNKAISAELQNRVPELNASTIHSYAFGIFSKAIGYPKANSSKIFFIATSHVAVNYPYLEWDEASDLVQDIIDPFNMARMTRTDLYDDKEMSRMCFERGVVGYSKPRVDDYRVIEEVACWTARKERDYRSLSPKAAAVVNHLQTSGYKGSSRIPKQPWIDFNEMIMIPLDNGLIIPENDYVLWDEAQDSNQLFYEFIKATVVDGGRIIAVGDYRQNIMGFAGSFVDGMQSLIAQMNATVLPLDISYRLPVKHALLSQEIFPGTEPAPWAIEGEIFECNYSALRQAIQEADDPSDFMVICRTNAPAIAFAMSLIAARIPAYVKGRDFGDQLVKIISKIGLFRKKPRQGLVFKENFLEFVMDWRSKEQQKLIAKEAGDRAFDILDDKAASIIALWEGTEADNIYGFIEDVNALFSEGSGVTLSSIHRSKGLEARFVGVLDYDKFWANHRSVVTDSQVFGENCVRYVALTRAKEVLYLATSDDRYGE